jgi:hypothetical protein
MRDLSHDNQYKQGRRGLQESLRDRERGRQADPACMRKGQPERGVLGVVGTPVCASLLRGCRVAEVDGRSVVSVNDSWVVISEPSSQVRDPCRWAAGCVGRRRYGFLGPTLRLSGLYQPVHGGRQTCS